MEDEETTLTGWRALRSDSRGLRLAIVIAVALAVLFYFARATGIVRSSRNFRQIAPQPIVIPTPFIINPTEDDDIVYPGETLGSYIEGSDFETWFFSADSGNVVDIMVRPVGEFDPEFDVVIELFAPDGQRLIKLDENLGGQPEIIRGLELPQPGEYNVWVSESQFDNGGNYILTIMTDWIKATHPQRIGLGQTLNTEIASPEMQYYVFTANEGQSLSVTMRGLGDNPQEFNPYIEIFTPSGQYVDRVTLDDPKEIKVQREILLPESGNYTVWVGEDGFDNDGIVSLAIHANQPKDQFIEQ